MSLGAVFLIALWAAATVAALRWPLVGACSLLAFDFLRPQDIHTELGSLRPVLWLAAATLVATVWHDRAALARAWRPLLPLLAVVAVAAISAAASDLGGPAWAAWLALAKTTVVAALVVVHVDSPRRFEAALWCVAGSIAIVSLAAIVHGMTIGYPDAFNVERGGIGGPPGRFSAQWPEGDGPMRDNNAFARVLVFGLPLFGALCSVARSHLARAVAVAGGVAIAIALMLTFSRTGFVAVAAIAVLAVLQIRPRWKAAAVLVVVVVVGYAATPEIYHDRMASVTLQDYSLRLRYGIWAEGLKIAASHPLVGVGIGTFSEHYALAAPPPPRSAHNVFVEVSTEMGVLGLAAYLWLLGSAFWRLLRLAASRDPATGDWPASRAARGLALALAGYLVASTTLSHAFSPQLVSGLALAFALTWRRRTEWAPDRARRSVLPLEATG